MRKNTTFIVIPNWNGADMIAECLESLESQSLKAEIVVVENGSTDDSADIIRSRFSGVTLLEFDNNAGFAGGVNRGISYALENGAEYIALFNNDAVAEKDWLKKLLGEMEKNSKYGIVTGKLLRTDKKHIDSTGDFYTIWGLPFPRGRNQKDNGQFDKAESVFSASGGASLYKAKLFREVGLFDEDFFAYYEDVDISFRARIAGWEVRYTPEAVAYHGVGGTSSKMGDFTRFHSAKNFLLLYARNMPSGLYIKYLPLFFLQLLRLLLGSLAKGKPGPFLHGTWAALKLHKKTVGVRKTNLAKQKVPTSEIDTLLTHSRPPRIPSLGD